MKLNFRYFATLVLAASLGAWAGPVSWHGALTVSDAHIRNSDGTRNVQVKGPSLYWSSVAGAPQYSQKTVDWFVENMDISVIRAAMAIKYWDNTSSKPIYDGMGNFGYLSSEEPTAKAQQLDRIETVIKAAIANDIYVIVDWHSHAAHNETAEATAFFKDIATRYKGVPNLIFEIYNEPTNSVSWSQVETYARTVIAAIRGTGNTNLILVGSPSWSSNPHQGATSSLHKDFANIAYSLHFYAGTHFSDGSQRTNANYAIRNGAAVFVSEWGTTLASGTGSVDASSSTNWTTWMDSAQISSCNWSAVNLDELSAMWAAGKENTIANLSESGKIFNQYMQKKISAPTGYPTGKSVTVAVNEGVAKSFSLTDLGASAGAVFKSVSTLPDSLGTLVINGSTITYTAPSISPVSQVVFNYSLEYQGKTSMHRVTANINRSPRYTATSLSVSNVKATTLSLAKLGATDPENISILFSQATVDKGTVSVSADKKSLVYTPSAAMSSVDTTRIALSATLTDGNSSTVAEIELVAANGAPVIGNKVTSIPNTAAATWTLANLVVNDPDGDSVTFASAVVTPGYPGKVTLSADKKSVIYTPAAGLISGERVTVLLNVTDGKNVSADGKLILTITGTGAAIAFDPSTPIVRAAVGANLDMRWQGQGLLEVQLASASPARLDVRSISGRRLGGLMLDGVGSQMVTLADFMGAPGVYWLTLRQDGQEKVLRVVKY